MNYFYPDIYQKSIYTINYDKLKENGIKCILFDLDNTCVPYVDKTPTKKLSKLFDTLKEKEFKIIIFSNSPKTRLEKFKKELNVDCCYSAQKPRKTKFLKVLKNYNYDISEVAIVGDQLVTDILGGNRVGIVGSGVIENGQVININYISSLNIRIARQQIGCSQKVMSNIINSETNTIYNTLIISPPRMWKNNIIKRYNKKLK